MTKCKKCGTGWTSSGLPLCPICGTKVPAAVADPVPLIEMPAAEPAVVRKTGAAVMEMPPERRKPRTAILSAPQPEPPPVLPKAEPEKAPERPKPEITLLSKPPPPPEALKPKTEILPAPEPEPQPQTDVLAHVFESAPVLKKEYRVEAPTRLRLIDPSAADIPVQQDLPSPTRPLVGPLVLGALAFVPALLVPLTAAFESTRVLGVLGFCMSGFFAPFAPIAWMVGLAAEQRRRDQGLRSEWTVTLGRRLGQSATMVLVGELTILLIIVAALRLSGQFPTSFWSAL